MKNISRNSITVKVWCASSIENAFGGRPYSNSFHFNYFFFSSFLIFCSQPFFIIKKICLEHVKKLNLDEKQVSCDLFIDLGVMNFAAVSYQWYYLYLSSSVAQMCHTCRDVDSESFKCVPVKL